MMRKQTSYSLPFLCCLAGLAVQPAAAGPTYENGSGGSFTFWGQLSPAWVTFDDGEDSTDGLADNAKSNSRVGFSVTQPMASGYELNFKFETALGLYQTSSLSQFAPRDALHWDRENLRFVDFSLKTPSYGTFYLGQGSMATDVTSSLSFSGTGVVEDVALGDGAGGFFLRQSDGVLSDVVVGDAFNYFEGSRRGRIRYDSPDYNGFLFRTSYGRNILVTEDGDDYYDAALAYDNETANGITISAAIGYSIRDRKDGQEDTKETFFSGAFLLPSGFNMALSAGHREDGGTYYYTQVGYNANWVSWGETSVSASYYDANDMVTDGDSSESWGLAMVQKIESVNTELYAAYRSYDYDDELTSYQKADSVVLGARWQF